MEFRKRSLKLGREMHIDEPITVENDFFGYDIIVYHNIFYAIPRFIRMPEFAERDAAKLEKFIHAAVITEVKTKIIKKLNSSKSLKLMSKALYYKRPFSEYVALLKKNVDSRINKFFP